MAIELIDFDDAYRDHRNAVVSLHYSAWGGLDDLAKTIQVRRAGFPFAPYLGVYAREGGLLLSGVFVSHYPLTTPTGPETGAGIELLMTRPDATRRGLARELLREVHRRERKAGTRLVLLCTGRSNLAHELYLKHGYQDIFSPRTALHFVETPTAKAPRGIRVRRVRPSDAAALARVHHRVYARAHGFTRRHPRSFRIRFLSGVDAARNLLVAERQGRVEGYATLEPHSTWSRGSEVVAPTSEVRAALMAALERRTIGRWLALGSEWLSGDGESESDRYTPLLPSYAVLMACPLTSELQGRNLYEWFRSGGRPFACQLLDMF